MIKMSKEMERLFKALLSLNYIKTRIQLIQTYTDDERILAQCNLILKEIEKEGN